MSEDNIQYVVTESDGTTTVINDVEDIETSSAGALVVWDVQERSYLWSRDAWIKCVPSTERRS